MGKTMAFYKLGNARECVGGEESKCSLPPTFLEATLYGDEDVGTQAFCTGHMLQWLIAYGWGECPECGADVPVEFDADYNTNQIITQPMVARCGKCKSPQEKTVYPKAPAGGRKT